ncbi:S-layer homology domain-containing protein [Paenibacillus sp. PK3_47]|uniref:S-layer homology domain-containing protein n=1 Tax=Paenibacillus sp. PK3_47 TaxID=2072642 RepID=UPI00201D97E8|nr:S-layer homology domain-containing protein [Paenibacillus sp. PK3_47]UQZ32347.1 S-layer homology domain-containing protein [Paenibacillus sp. PK3_47]
MSGQKKSKPTMRAYSTKAATAVLAGAMMFGGAGSAFAAPPAASKLAAAAGTTQAAATAGGVFSDVKTGLWAEKHIYKLASQGIVVGNNGLFRPGDSVTQQEAVLMALRFMKLQGNADLSTDVVLPTNFKVTNYYKPYVVLAFQQGLLDKTVEMDAGNLETSWGERKASREWIAELLIRSLNKSGDAAALSGQPTGFADDAKVSANKRGYINAAVNLGLANGLDGNRFDPQGAVTRAQLATFFSRAEAHNTLDYDNTYKGTISALKDGKMTIYNNGVSSDFNLTSGTAYFTSTSETRISQSDIQPYTNVTVIGATYNAAYVEVTDPTPQVASSEGTIAKITPGVIWLDSATGYDQLGYDSNTVFMDVNGAVVDGASITPNSKVTLLRETYSGSHKVVKVQVTSGFVNKSAAGTIQSVDLAAKSITFINASGSPETFKWEDGTALFSSQSNVLLPSDLKAGSAVKYTIQNNMIRSVEVTSGVERTVEGYIYELTGSTIVYQKADGSREVKLLAATPAIVIPNAANSVAADLIADKTGGDQVRLTLNSSEQVIKIEVLKRQIEQYSGATVVDYNDKTQLLTFTDASQKAHVVKINESTKLSYDGAPAAALSSMAARLVENRRIDVSSIDDRALSVDITTKYTGTLASINPATRTIGLKLSNGQSLTMPYPNTVDLFGKPTATISDVPLDTPVLAVLTANQSTISVLQVNSSVQLQVATVNSTTNKLGVKWAGGSTEFYTLAVPMTNEAGQKISISELKAGDFINVNFAGNNPTSIQAVKVYSGQVSALDAAAGTFTVKDYTGVSQTFSAATGVRVVRDSTTTTALGSITTADRVEVRKDADGAVLIRVLPQQSRTVSRYDSASNKLITKRATLGDNNYQFTIAPNVYIHQGDTTLSVQSLKENDNIIVYFNNDVVVEIVKQ